MYTFIEPFGYHINGNSIGETWLSLVDAINTHGEHAVDEGRNRLCLQNVRVRVNQPQLPDKLIDTHADKKKIEDIIYLTFQGEKMYDCDIKPSFSPGAKSYHARLKEGEMVRYIVERLSLIPESKKAIISFIHWDDYKAVLKNPYDDYLPCITTIQFRLLETKNGYDLNVIFNARSIDAFQKSNGNMIAITMLANTIKEQLEKNLKKTINFSLLEGLITDAHIYEECYDDSKTLVQNIKKDI